MTIEDAQQQVSAVVFLYPLFTPFLVLSAIACFVYRRSRWVAPFWVVGACFVLSLIGLLVRTYIAMPSNRSGPDWGFVGMGNLFIYLFSLWELIPGILLLLAYPRGDAWGRHSVFPCLLTATLSFVGFISFLPKVPPDPDSVGEVPMLRAEPLFHVNDALKCAEMIPEQNATGHTKGSTY
jgi:hypothetical protein